MYDRHSNESRAPSLRIDGSLVIPILIGASWLALAVASLVQLNQMGRAIAEARCAKERAAEVSTNAVATCPSPSGVAVRAN